MDFKCCFINIIKLALTIAEDMEVFDGFSVCLSLSLSELNMLTAFVWLIFPYLVLFCQHLILFGPHYKNSFRKQHVQRLIKVQQYHFLFHMKRKQTISGRKKWNRTVTFFLFFLKVHGVL